MSALKEEKAVKSKIVFRSPTFASQNPETELVLDGEDDNVSLLQEKEMDNVGGPVVLSSSAQLVAPVLVARGTLSITTSEIYFEVDEDDPAFKRVDPKVSNLQGAGRLVSCTFVVFPVLTATHRFFSYLLLVFAEKSECVFFFFLLVCLFGIILYFISLLISCKKPVMHMF
ncbi:hypothetical protein ILYODFUR_005971 [Ilyodon furcidens]|uniref:BEACH-type PH domain-containing protein n=1 Tax=Ilyodon furcidens TaxID=33524 RepID=A0ABV0T5K9_9TELE